MLNTDRPIDGEVDDTLGRSESADLFARSVLELDASQGLVVGVLGPWGSGKTSYVNLARRRFQAAGATLVDFNPWMFSGIDRLVDAFFAEISAELKVRPGLNDVGNELAEYGELLSGLGWIPVVGPWAERLHKVLGLVSSGMKKSKGGTAARRKRVETALSKLDKPVVVVLDDIDRLPTAEIRQVFQLVRLTASFPNVVYVLAFDRERVEKALSEDGIPGRAYLEKILQIAVDLPVVPVELLQAQLFSALDTALSGIEVGELDQNVWPNLFIQIIWPLVGNMRDVRRYAMATRGTLNALGNQIAPGDVLALDAVRLFLPDVFALIRSNISLLTTVDDGMHRRGSDEQGKAAVDQFLHAAGSKSSVARAMLKELFPASRRYIDNYHYGYDWQARWLRESRVAHESYLRLYLERIPSEPLKAHVAARRAFELLGDRDSLDRFLRSLSTTILEDVIAGLEAFEDEYRPEHVVPGVVTLLTLLPSIPERPRGMFDFGAGLKVTRVTYRLLRSLKEPAEIEKAVRAILPQLELPSLKWEVITDVGYREGAGHRLVSSDAATALEGEWRAEVRATSEPVLERDPDLLRVVAFAQDQLAEGEPKFQVPASNRITHRLLESARSETRSQSIDSYAVRREGRLAWKLLATVLGGEDQLHARVDALLSSDYPIDRSLRELVARYRGGWRPAE